MLPWRVSHLMWSNNRGIHNKAAFEDGKDDWLLVTCHVPSELAAHLNLDVRFIGR